MVEKFCDKAVKKGNFSNQMEFRKMSIKPHLICAQTYWRQTVCPGDTIIDATVGNGHDTILLAQLLKGEGYLIGYDIQPAAIAETRKKLLTLPDTISKTVTLKLQSHAQFEETNVKLIVYNLGYLPRGNKNLTTLSTTTLLSIQNGLASLSQEGALSITCYPGHPEGALEEQAILDFLKTLPSNKWLICFHQWINRPCAPSFIWLQMKLY